MRQLYFRILLITGMFLGLQACNSIEKSIEDTLDPPAAKAKRIAEEKEKEARQAPVPKPRPFVAEPVKEEEPVNIFDSEHRLDSVQQVLIHLPRFKGKKLMFYDDIYFHDDAGGRISLSLQDPEIPENIDEYEYEDGAWQDPKPVKLRRNNHTGDYLMPLEKIRFGTAKKIQEITRKEAAALNEGTEGTSYIHFINSATFRIREWRTSVTGTRHDYSLYFTIDGKLKQLEKD